MKTDCIVNVPMEVQQFTFEKYDKGEIDLYDLHLYDEENYQALNPKGERYLRYFTHMGEQNLIYEGNWIIHNPQFRKTWVNVELRKDYIPMHESHRTGGSYILSKKQLMDMARYCGFLVASGDAPPGTFDKEMNLFIDQTFGNHKVT